MPIRHSTCAPQALNLAHRQTPQDIKAGVVSAFTSGRKRPPGLFPEPGLFLGRFPMKMLRSAALSVLAALSFVVNLAGLFDLVAIQNIESGLHGRDSTRVRRPDNRL